MAYINGHRTLQVVRTKYLNVDDVYPVGAVYISFNSTSPASLFGGTWEQIQDKFLLASGITYQAGATGGNATHSHTLGNGYAKQDLRGESGYGYAKEKTVEAYLPNKKCETADQYVDFSDWTVTGAIELGGSTDNASNMPPYLTVYIWKRTA